MQKKCFWLIVYYGICVNIPVITLYAFNIVVIYYFEHIQILVLFYLFLFSAHTQT